MFAFIFYEGHVPQFIYIYSAVSDFNQYFWKCSFFPIVPNSFRYFQNLKTMHIFIEKMLLLTFAPKEDSNQPAYPRIVNSVFVVSMKTFYILGYITKTCLYNFDPLKPHFYIVKLGFTGVYIIFLISAQIHRLWVLVRTASRRRF